MQLKRIAGIGCGAVLALVALLAVVTSLLPSGIALQTSRQLEAPPERVFPLLGTQDGLLRWWAVASKMASLDEAAQ